VPGSGKRPPETAVGARYGQQRDQGVFQDRERR
jgi:hypothetical protein